MGPRSEPCVWELAARVGDSKLGIEHRLQAVFLHYDGKAFAAKA